MKQFDLFRPAVASRFRTGIVLMLPVFASVPCLGQSVQPLVPGSVVTGACNGHDREPGCVLPTLFGSSGLSLFPNPRFPHYAHFIGSAQTTLNQTLGTAIATQLAILPIISPSSGFTYKYDSAAGAFVRSTTSFGPIYADRAETVGRGKASFGVSYQRFRFSTIDGIDLHKLPVVFSHLPNTGPGNAPETYETDVIRTNNNVDLNIDSTMVYGTIGVTDRVDVSVAVPFVSVRMNATSDAEIIRVSGPTVSIPGVGTIPNPHQFTSDPNSLTASYVSGGSASGIGDVTFRVKANVLQARDLSVALAVDVRTPTGDARRLLGSGAIGIKPFVTVSASGERFSPHVNVGYQWNGSSTLAGNLTGTTIGEDATGAAVVQSGSPMKESLPAQVFYSVGTELGATRNMTLVFDYLGQTMINAPRVFRSNYVTDNIAGGTGAVTIPTISGGKDTAVLSSAAVGVKYNLFGKLLLTGNVLFRLDNKGLRQNVTPLIALSYAFGGK